MNGHSLKTKRIALIAFFTICVLFLGFKASGVKSEMIQSAVTSLTICKPSTISNPPMRLNMTKVASMIETRALPHLIPLITNFLAVVPQDWPFVIWTSVENHWNLTEASVLQRDIASGRLNFTMINTDMYKAGADTATLSAFLAGSNYFWNSFHPDAEWMLFFQR
jgi:hypothetical protein